MKLLKNNFLLVLILCTSFFFRIYNAPETLSYAHDQDLASWVIRDIIQNKPIRLIGQETSTRGVFIGSLYYYLQIPFYALTNWDPIGTIFLGAFLGLFTTWSIYYVLLEVWKKKDLALWGSGFYTFSFFFVYNDRQIVPTTPMVLWTVWFFYTLNCFKQKKDKKGFLFAAILLSLVWHIHASLALVFILIPLIFLLKKRIPDIKELLFGLITFFVTSLPFFLFEIRHNFLQTRSIFLSLSTDQGVVLSKIEQLQKVWYTFLLNSSNILWFPDREYLWIVPIALLLYGLDRLYNVKKDRVLMIALFVWIAILFAFFALYSKPVSEYYLHGLLFPLFLLFVLFFHNLWTSKNRSLAIIIGILFLLINLDKFVHYPNNDNGYKERKAIVQEISRDARDRGYKCISISYITDIGYDLGYRYLFILENLQVNHPSRLSPVYTIVYPMKPAFDTPVSFGGIGLIYPDYGKYTNEGIKSSCEGEDDNITYPMFGFTN